MWLTWYQVVDYVCHLQSNMAKGKCSIEDSLNTKVSPIFDTPFPCSYWPRTKSTSSIKHVYQSLPTIDLPPHRSPKDTSTRCDATSSSQITLDPLELPIICISYIYRLDFVFQLDGKKILRADPVPPATFPPMDRFKHEFVGLRELILRDCNAVIWFIGSNSISMNIQNKTGF